MDAQKKLIGISVPCYNEVNNVGPLAEEIVQIFTTLPQYDYYIQFIDNHSTDGTREVLRRLCGQYSKVRAILNAKNFPQTSGYYGLLQIQADCAIAIPSDFQVPLDTIPQMLDQWEQGAQIVCLVKSSSQESSRMWGVRQLFYKLSSALSETTVIKNYNGCGLYDKKFMDFCRGLNDPVASFTQLVAQYGYNIVKLPYTHVARKSGKSKQTLMSLVDIAILRFTSTSSMGPRIATIMGLLIALASVIIGIIYFILKLIFWSRFPAGMAPLLIGVFFIGALQIFFIGLVGEYVTKANLRLMNRPMVIEEERLNFDDQADAGDRDV